MRSAPLLEDVRLARRVALRIAPLALGVGVLAALADALLRLPVLPALLAGILLGPPIARALRGVERGGGTLAGAVALVLVGLAAASALLPGAIVAVGSVLLLAASNGLPPFAVFALWYLIPPAGALLSLGLALYLLARLGIATPAAVAGDVGGVASLGLSWRLLSAGRWRGQLARRLVGWAVQLLLLGNALLIATLAPPLAAASGVLAAVIGDTFGRAIAQAFYERVRT